VAASLLGNDGCEQIVDVHCFSVPVNVPLDALSLRFIVSDVSEDIMASEHNIILIRFGLHPLRHFDGYAHVGFEQMGAFTFHFALSARGTNPASSAVNYFAARAGVPLQRFDTLAFSVSKATRVIPHGKAP